MGLRYQGTETLASMTRLEEISIDSYRNRIKQAEDPELLVLFTQILKEEEAHLQMLKQLKQKIIPLIAESKYKQHSSNHPGKAGQCSRRDAYLCHDALDGEKSASAGYDRLIFTVRNAAARDVLNYIQSQEQNHGRMLCEYMDSKQIYY